MTTPVVTLSTTSVNVPTGALVYPPDRPVEQDNPAYVETVFGAEIDYNALNELVSDDGEHQFALLVEGEPGDYGNATDDDFLSMDMKYHVGPLVEDESYYVVGLRPGTGTITFRVFDMLSVDLELIDSAETEAEIIDIISDTATFYGDPATVAVTVYDQGVIFPGEDYQIYLDEAPEFYYPALNNYLLDSMVDDGDNHHFELSFTTEQSESNDPVFSIQSIIDPGEGSIGCEITGLKVGTGTITARCFETVDDETVFYGDPYAIGVEVLETRS